MILVYLERWSYGRFKDDNKIFYKMKNDLTTGTWQDDIWCPIIIILLCTSDDLSICQAVLHPVAFCARRCGGNKDCLHSHLGEGFCWWLGYEQVPPHMPSGQCFVWVTDCYAIKFIILYIGANHAILRLQCAWCVEMLTSSTKMIIT